MSALRHLLRPGHRSRLDPAGPSRRTFLGLGVGGVASVALPAALGCCRRPSDASPRVAIVGAGLAGLHCAYRLRQAGVRGTLYEAASRIGGRIATACGLQLGDQVAELGAEFISTGHRTMWWLADELDVVLDDLEADAPSFQELWYVRGGYVAESTLAEQLLEVWPAVLEGVASNLHVGAEDRPLDRISLAEWLDLQVPERRYPELHSVLVSAYRSELGLDPDEQSALNLVFLLATDDPEPFWTYGALDGRYHCHDGNDSFVAALARRLPGQIQQDARLEALTLRPDGSFRLSLRRASGGGFEATAEHVVLAAPFTTLRDVALPTDMHPLKRAAIDELGYGTNAKITGAFRSRVWRHRHDASGSATTDLGAQQIWDASIGQEGVLGEVTSLVGGAAGRAASRGTAEEWMCGVLLPALEEVFPGSRAAYLPGSAFRMCWAQEPLAGGSYSCYRPGQWRFEGLEGRREGNIHFCGEHCSPGSQSWMEGAAETGALAAAEVLDDAGVPPSPQHEQLLDAILTEPHPCYHGGTQRRARSPRD